MLIYHNLRCSPISDIFNNINIILHPPTSAQILPKHIVMRMQIITVRMTIHGQREQHPLCQPFQNRSVSKT